MFWKYKDDLLKVSKNEAEAKDWMNDILFKSKIETCEYCEIGKTGIFIGNFLAGKPPECWGLFDAVINCSDEEFEAMESMSYLFLKIPAGKKGGAQFLNSIPKLLSFVEPFIIKKQRILLHSRYGNYSC